MADYQAYDLNIQDIGEGYTDADIERYQALIDEELERIPDVRCSVRVVTNETRSRRDSVEFCNDERINLALGLAYARFLDDASEITRAELAIDEWETIEAGGSDGDESSWDEAGFQASVASQHSADDADEEGLNA